MRDVYGCLLRFGNEPRTSYEVAVERVLRWVGETYDDPAALAEKRDEGTWTPAKGESVRWETTKHPGKPDRLWVLTWKRMHEGDPGLRWHYEVRIGLTATECWTWVRVAIESTAFRMAPLIFSVARPSIVPLLIGALKPAADGRILREAPEVMDDTKIRPLADLLLDHNRTLPVVVITPRNDSPKTLVEPKRVSTYLAGLAHVIQLADARTSRALSQILGQPLSIYDGGVRIYWPGMTAGDDPKNHPRYLREAIVKLEYQWGSFAQFLLRTLAPIATMRTPITKLEAEIKVAFAQARKKERKETRTRIRTAGIGDEWMKELETAWRETERLENENEDLAARLKELTDELESAQTSLAQLAQEQEPEVADTAPRSVAEAVQEGAERCSNLVFLEEAFESAWDSPYQQPDKVLSSLIALDEIGGRYARNELAGGFSVAFEQAGLPFKSDVSQTALGKYPQEYRRSYNGKTIMLGPHIAFGARTPRTCLRIYFYIDEEARKFVVGHVGNHLRDTTTG